MIKWFNKWRNWLLGGPNSFGGPLGQQKDPISKNRKSLIQNGGPNTHPKFQHSSSIRKCSKIGGTAGIRRRRTRTRNTSYTTFGPFWHISKSHKNFNIGHFDTRIFAICSSVPSEAIEVLKIKIYAWEPCKKKRWKMTKTANSLAGYIALLRQLALLCKVGSAIAATIARWK